MNYLTISFIALIGLLLSYTGLRLFKAIHGNFHTAAALRNQYAQRIRLLPMYKMLRMRGIELNHFLSQSPVAEIETRIRNCESCNKDRECQTALKEKTEQDFSFCTNDPVFIKAEETLN